jgi:hypothetical protein
MTDDPTGGRAELAQRLRELCRGAGNPSTRKIAEDLATLGVTWSQSKVSRTMNGRTATDPDEVGTLCDLFRASASERAQLVELAREVLKANRRLVLGRDPAAAQTRIGRFQRDASLVRCVALTTIPGELQTPDYVHAVFRGNEAGARQRLLNQTILDEVTSARQFRLLLGESALGWTIVPPAKMAQQLDHVAASIDRRNVTIGILSWGQVIPRLPQHSWYLYDSRLVVTGGATYALDLSDPDDVAAYTTLTDQYEQLAVYGDEARAILTRAADRYRQL